MIEKMKKYDIFFLFNQNENAYSKLHDDINFLC